MTSLTSAAEGHSEPCQPSQNSVRLCPAEYAKHNKVQRKFGEFVLDFCELAFGAELDSSQQFLDVGCATGDFTREVLLPRCLPCRMIVGVDCSREMVEYARINSAHEKLDFRVLDIAGDVSGFLEEFGHFDRIYSFLCLHWVDDIAAAFKNISQLMSPTGECLLAFCAVQELADVWKALAVMDRWAKYSEILLKFVPKTQDKQDFHEHLKFVSGLLQEAGLFPTIKEVLKSTIFRGWSDNDVHAESEQGIGMKKGTHSVAVVAIYMNTLPIVNLITEEEESELNATVRELTRTMDSPDSLDYPYKVFIIKASKIPC